jgi:hypothetical protein
VEKSQIVTHFVHECVSKVQVGIRSTRHRFRVDQNDLWKDGVHAPASQDSL